MMSSPRLPKPAASTSTRRRQHGGETVEFALLALPFFLLLFAVTDFAFAVFNQGVVNRASAVAARQGSLYWLDPTRGNYSPTDPLGNVRVNEHLITSAVDFYNDRVLLRFGGSTLSANPDLAGAAEIGSTPNRIWNELPDALVDVPLTFVHNFILLGGLGFDAGYTMDARTQLGTELN